MMSRLSGRLFTVLTAFTLAACAASDTTPEPQDTDPAIAQLKSSIAQDSSNWQTHAQLASELRRKNRLEEAAAAANKAVFLAPGPGLEARLELAKVFAAADRSAAAINLVKEAERRKREGEALDEVKIAEVYAILGDVPAVFRWLERAVTAKSPNLATLAQNPDFVSVHDDERWQEILAKTQN